MGKLKKMIKDKKGMSYPLTVALVLALLIVINRRAGKEKK